MSYLLTAFTLDGRKLFKSSHYHGFRIDIQLHPEFNSRRVSVCPAIDNPLLPHFDIVESVEELLALPHDEPSDFQFTITTERSRNFHFYIIAPVSDEAWIVDYDVDMWGERHSFRLHEDEWVSLYRDTNVPVKFISPVKFFSTAKEAIRFIFDNPVGDTWPPLIDIETT